MRPALRKFMLSVHVTASVGWIGAVLAYLALVVAAMLDTENRILTAAWIGFYVMGCYAIVPLSLAALLTGIIMSLGTPWGLFRHYWVIISLALTILATLILIQHMQTVNDFAAMAAEGNAAHLPMLRDGLGGEVFHAGIGLVVLIVVQLLNVYKPRGITPYGWRKQQEQRKAKENLQGQNA
jgi:hypothetical protein